MALHRALSASMKTLKDTLRGREKRGSISSTLSSTSTISAFSTFSTTSTLPETSSPRPQINRSLEPGLDGGLRSRSAQPTRMVNVDGWMELRYGESNKKDVLELIASSGEGGFQRRYWFQLMGGFLTWFAQEDHNFSHHTHVGRLDLKNDVVEMKDVTYDPDTKLHRIGLITEETVHRKSQEEIQIEGKLITKTSIKNIVERCEYLLCTPDELVIYRWRDALKRAVRRRHQSSPNPKSGTSSPTPSRSSLDSPNSTFSRSSSSSPPPTGHMTMRPSASSPDGFGLGSASPGLSADNKGRLVKQQGFLELETRVEASGQPVSLTKATYWFELLGGYLVWYDLQNHTSQPIGRIQVKAGDSVGELTQKEQDGKRIVSFTFAVNEEIYRREEKMKDENEHTFLKTTLKKETTTYTLSTTDFAQGSEWRAQVAAMARRKIMSYK